MKEIRVALLGYKFMGKAHSFAYGNVRRFFELPAYPVMKVVCGRSEIPLRAARERFGWEECETDWRKVVSRDDIDVVDISTPPDMHRDIAVAAAKAGKAVFCEKPLAATMKDACAMMDAAVKHGIPHAICFNYRKLPAIGLAKQLIADGKLGVIRHMRAVYLQDWIMDPGFPLVWRLRREVAGSGAHGDLNAHLIDLARHLVGEFDRVVGMSRTFIGRRPLLKESTDLKTGLAVSETLKKTGPVTVDDATLFLAEFANGAVGSFEATRFAAGRRNGQSFEINGSRGSIVFNLERLNELQYYNADDPACAQGFRTIMATNASHPYAGAWWPDGHIIGYGESFVNMAADLCASLAAGKNPSPDFHDGIKCQQVLQAVERSVASGTWKKVAA